MHLVSCTNTHHFVIYLVNYEMVKNTKTWIPQEQNITFLWDNKNQTLSNTKCPLTLRFIVYKLKKGEKPFFDKKQFLWTIQFFQAKNIRPIPEKSYIFMPTNYLCHFRTMLSIFDEVKTNLKYSALPLFSNYDSPTSWKKLI